jgi:hypothetical protein
MTVPATAPTDLHEPPPPIRTVLTVGLAGVGIALLALVLGVITGAPTRGFDPHWADKLRMLLAAVGLIVTGCAVSMRPRFYGVWLCAAAAGLIGYGFGLPAPEGTEWMAVPPRDWYSGVPNSWDSIHIFFGVAGGIGLAGAAATGLGDLLRQSSPALPAKVGAVIMLLGVAYHFSTILSAITSPPPTPWMTDQYWKRISRPYVLFAYMNNAYQFYSPDPGPACELWVCFEYDTGNADPDAEKDCEWEYIPRRTTDFRDPLGLSFYRRLSITENVAQYATNQVPDLQEQEQVLARRNLAVREGIPRRGWTDEQERRLPNDLVTRQLLPSYARHLAAMHGNPDKKLKSVRLYRTLHMLVQLNEMHGYDAALGHAVDPVRPGNPRQYLAYFQGEFDPKTGALVDPVDPMLYWLVPIVQDRRLPEDPEEYKRNGGFHHYFTDYVSKHAGCPRPIKE